MQYHFSREQTAKLLRERSRNNDKTMSGMLKKVSAFTLSKRFKIEAYNRV